MLVLHAEASLKEPLRNLKSEKDKSAVFKYVEGHLAETKHDSRVLEGHVRIHGQSWPVTERLLLTQSRVGHKPKGTILGR